MMRCAAACALVTLLAGCGLLPRAVHQANVHNPFPQLTKVAVAPFFNLSTEPSADGRQFALAYFNELQSLPGFEAIPVGVVEQAVRTHHISLANPDEARRLAQILGADAIVIGAITDFSPYYPPRCGLQVEWYAANPGFHPIPPGYGLPWGTPEEEDIPGPLVLEAEMALAREQLKTQTPDYDPEALLPIPKPAEEESSAAPGVAVSAIGASKRHVGTSTRLDSTRQGDAGAPPRPETIFDRARASQVAMQQSDSTRRIDAQGSELLDASGSDALPPDWPDPRGFVPLPPMAYRPQSEPSDEPVLRHTRTYNGHDGQFTAALENYAFFRDDARFGGWQSYLQRSDDFIRFCCHLHLTEMLTARGGAGETRVVWRWDERR